MGENTIYVAVNQDVRESKKTLEWTLKTFPGKKICLLHVHIPFSLTSSSSWLDESMFNAIHESQVKDSYDSLYKYRDICTNKGVNEEDVDISLTSAYDVGEGIVELIYQNNITKLVMGAAADPHYLSGMSITSRKAEYVSQHAPNCCKMWFICKGKLIKTKEGSFDIGNPSDSFTGFFYDSAEKPYKERIGDDHEPESPKEHPRWIPETEESPTEVNTGPGMTKHKENEKEDSSPDPDSDEPHRLFFCPITMEIMKDPHVAADGHSYEGEVIKSWIRQGGQTSPKTRARLAHYNLTPNFTLSLLITEWLQKHPNYSPD